MTTTTNQNKKKKAQARLSFLSRYQELYPDAHQWARLQYFLQMSMGNVSLFIKRLFVINNASIQASFISSNQGKTTLDFIVCQNQLNDEDFPSVCEKGFKNSLTANYGQIQIDKMTKEFDNYYEVMICKIAVGSTFIYPSKNTKQNLPIEQKPDEMSQDFDSLFLYDQNLATKQFKQQYVVYDTKKKCLPSYIIHFGVDQTKYKQLQQKIICEDCEDNVAIKYCETQETYFCLSCDNKHHNGKIGVKHKRSEIAQKTKKLGDCTLHPNLKLELFCMQCHRPICINCKVKGDHSLGQYLTHPLIRISERYQQASKHLRQADISLQKKKKILSAELQEVSNKLKDINRKSLEIQEKIYQILQNALKELQHITKKKMALLMSDHIELKRQLDSIQWIQKFIKYEHEILSPNDFLLAWSRHLNLRRQKISNQFACSNITPNIHVQGFVHVVTEEMANKKQQKRIGKEFQFDSPNKSKIFKQAEQINQNTMKIKLPIEKQENQKNIMTTGGMVRSQNNLLNLSILKHF